MSRLFRKRVLGKGGLGKYGQIAACCALVAACSTTRAPSDHEVVRAYRLYESGRCDDVRRRVSQIDWTKQDSKRKPFFDIMRAFCLELEGDTKQAADIYARIVQEAPKTHQAYEASLRLNDMRRLAESGTTREKLSEGARVPKVPEDGPEPIHKMNPVYPGAPKKAGVEGWVWIEFGITSEGDVVDPVVLQSNPPYLFDGAAVAAIRHWIYAPSVEAPKERTSVVLQFIDEERKGWSSRRSKSSE